MNILTKGAVEQGERLLAFRSSRLRTGLEFLVCALAGALCALAFTAPCCAFLGWFTLAPLVWLVTGGRVRKAFFLALTWGYAESLFAFMFLREIKFFIPFVLALVLGVFPALWGMFAPFLHRNFLIPPEVRLKGSEAVSAWRCRHPFREIAYCLALAAWWCVTEWVRSWIFTGLPWNLLGVSQWRILPLIQICEYTGVYGVSFLMVLVNVSLALFLYERRPRGGKRENAGHFFCPLFAAALVFLCLAWGLRSLKKLRGVRYDRTAKFGVVQPALSQRRSGGVDKVREALRVCADLSAEVLRKHPGGDRPELLIWPETAVPAPYNADNPLAQEYRETAGGLTFSSGLPLLTGSLYLKASGNKPGAVKVYNAALLLGRGGRILDSYRKVHLVPFGEYVPYRNIFPALNKMAGLGRDLTPGTSFRPVEALPGLRAGIAICYEDIFADISRAQARANANVLLVVTNDAWYPTSTEPYQHFVNSLFRAVETRLPVIRSGNASYTAAIDPAGRVSDALFRDVAGGLDPGRRARGAGVLRVSYQSNPPKTFYTRYGNVFIGLCAAYFLVILAFALLNWRTYRQALADVFKKPAM